MNAIEYRVLCLGIAQGDDEGLRLLIDHIDAGKPLLLNGCIYDDNREYG